MKKHITKTTLPAVDPIAAVLARVATDPAAAGAVALIGRTHTTTDLAALDKLAVDMNLANLPPAWRIEADRAMVLARRRLGDTAGADLLESVITATDGEALCTMMGNHIDDGTDSVHGLSCAYGYRVDALAPATVAGLIDRAKAAPDLRALYRVARCIYWLELDKEQCAGFDEAMARERARLAPETPALAARRAMLTDFLAFYDAVRDGDNPSEAYAAELVDWYATACAPGGPGLDTGCPYPERIQQEPETYHAPDATMAVAGGAK